MRRTRESGIQVFNKRLWKFKSTNFRFSDSGKGRGNTKSEVTHPLVSVEPVAHAGTHILWPVVPRTAAQHALCAIAFPASIRPLPYVAHYIV